MALSPTTGPTTGETRRQLRQTGKVSEYYGRKVVELCFAANEAARLPEGWTIEALRRIVEQNGDLGDAELLAQIDARAAAKAKAAKAKAAKAPRKFSLPYGTQLPEGITPGSAGARAFARAVERAYREARTATSVAAVAAEVLKGWQPFKPTSTKPRRRPQRS